MISIWQKVLNAFQVAVGLVLALFWLRSCMQHLINPYYFLSSIYNYQIVGPGSGMVLALIIPFLQLTLAACLLIRVYVGGALLGSLVMLSIFLVAQSSVLIRGLKIDCGCFGAVQSQQVSVTSLLSVALLLVLAVSAFLSWCLKGAWMQPAAATDSE